MSNPHQPSTAGGDAMTSAGHAPAVEPLLRTKLFLPRRRSGLVARQRLIDLLRSSTDARLILVDAPPGWGKTTVLVQWAAQQRDPVAWISLDPDDNDPVRFWTYLLAALQQALGDVGAHATSRLRIHGVDIVRDVLPEVVNDLAFRDEAFLVLDDYHVIGDRSVHKTMAALIDALPPQLHVVVATRADPPFNLPRLRARGELLELRAEQLRFTGVETATLFNDVLALQLAETDVVRLRERTEGWAAGLQLAGLSLRDRLDARGFIGRFAGDDRHVVDYLVAEVLDRLAPEMRRFLLHTAVLDRLCGALCDVVTQGRDSAAVLLDVERSNLFLVALDNQRRWFRYHHLFGELLRHELILTEPELVPKLHGRAASWFETEGDVAQAVHHATAAADLDLVARLVATHWRRFFNLGQLTTVQRWLNTLPPDRVVDDLGLSTAAVWLALDRGQLPDADRWLSLIENTRSPDPHGRLLRALFSFKAGDLGSSRRLLDAVDEGDGHAGGDAVDAEFMAVVRDCLLGVTAYWSGDYERAVRPLERAAGRAELTDNSLAYAYSQGYLALAHVRRGDDRAARDAVDLARRAVGDPAVGEHFVAMAAAFAEAQLGELDDDRSAADGRAGRAVELARRGAGRIELAAAIGLAAHLRRLRGDVTESRIVAAEARRVANACRDPGPVLGQVLTAGASAAHVPDPRTPEPLTNRELTILRMLPGTATNREIASALFVSPNTMKTHLKAIYRKIGATTREEAVRRARELGLLPTRLHSQVHQARTGQAR